MFPQCSGAGLRRRACRQSAGRVASFSLAKTLRLESIPGSGPEARDARAQKNKDLRSTSAPAGISNSGQHIGAERAARQSHPRRIEPQRLIPPPAACTAAPPSAQDSIAAARGRVDFRVAGATQPAGCSAKEIPGPVERASRWSRAGDDQPSMTSSMSSRSLMASPVSLSRALMSMARKVDVLVGFARAAAHESGHEIAGGSGIL